MLKVAIPMRFTMNPATETNCGYIAITNIQVAIAHGKTRKKFYTKQQGDVTSIINTHCTYNL